MSLKNPNHARIFYEWKKDPTNTAYHNIFMYQLEGDLNVAHLVTAIEALPHYYPELSAYLEVSTAFLHKKYAPTVYPVKVEDFSQKNITLAEGIKYIDQYLHLNFDLTCPPLYRHVLIKLPSNVYLLGVCWFHLIDDAVSVNWMVEKIAELYHQLLNGQALSYLPLQDPEQFDFTYPEEGLDYWRKKSSALQDFSIILPQQYRSVKKRATSKRHYFSLTQVFSKSVLSFSAEKEMTLFVVLTAAFASLCHRYSEQEQFAIGYSVSIRKRKDLGAVGYYVNNIPLCFTFNDDSTFNDILSEVQKQKEQDAPFQHVPLMEIMKSLRMTDATANKSLFNFLINQYPNDSFELKLKNVLITSIPVIHNDAKNDFTFFYDYRHQCINLEFEYRNDRFSDDFIKQLAESFEVMMHSLIMNPNQRLKDVTLLTPETAHTILYDWNCTNNMPLPQQTIIQLFARQVALNANAIAVKYKDQALTFYDMDLLSNKLAHCLLENHGVKKGDVIAIYHDRSVEVLIVILALIKIRAIYLPLDTSYPDERIEFILKDACPVLVLSEKKCFTFVKTVFLEAALQSHTTHHTFNWTNQLDDICYLLYTSGTTGQPKGVLNHQRGLLNRILWKIKQFDMKVGDTILLKTSLCFDISLWEIFAPLLSGASIAIADPGSQREPRELLQQIKAYDVTIMHFVPSMLKAFLDFIPVINTSLRVIISSGEALPFATVQLFYEKLNQVALFNLYGPTEASIDVTYWDCSRTDYPGIIPIGEALSNVEIYILDNQLKPVALGQKGEIYLGGIQVATGYLNRPELTEERFIANPFKEKGARLYKTGDVGRWLGKGCVEYIGRQDQQIKWHGYRIELDEIVFHLLSHPDVSYALVYLHKMNDEAKLMAFIVTKDEKSLDELELRDYLTLKLPKYMVPNQFCFVKTIPTTSQGKVDYKKLISLSEIDKRKQSLAVTMIIPERLRQIWADALSLNLFQVNEHTNFFTSGGDSLLALKIIAAMDEAYQVEIPVMSLLEFPILKDFYEWLQKECLTKKNIQQNELSQVSKSGLHPFSTTQLSLVTSHNHIVIPFQWDGQLDLNTMKSALKKLSERHLLLRANFEKHKESWFYSIAERDILLLFEDVSQEDAFSQELRFKKAHQLLLSQSSAIEAQVGFALSIFQLNTHQYKLLIYFNHLIVDRASMQLILNELFQLYDTKNCLTLPQSLAYHDYVFAEQQLLTSSGFDTQLTYWLSYLAFKKRNIWQAQQSQHASFYSERFAPHESEAVERTILAYQKTPFCVLLTLFCQTLASFLSEPTFAVGFTLSKRYQAKYNHTVGPMINYGTLLYESSTSVSDTLKNMERQIIDAYNHSDLPMKVILEQLTQLEERPQTQLFDVLFDYDAIPFEAHTVSNVKLKSLPLIHSDKMQRFLSVRMNKKQNAYSIDIRYRSALFKEQSIALLVAKFKEAFSSRGLAAGSSLIK